ncbi:MAG TPA: extensin family protein [Polyangiaceae bacterium]
MPALASAFVPTSTITPSSPAPAAAAPVAPPDPGRADIDPANDATVAPPELIADCEARLEAAGIRYGAASLPTRRAKEGHACGAPQVVVYRGPEGGVRWSSAPIVTCGMALALARFETVLQEESEKHFGERVARIEHLGTYACREMARYDWVSEHSYANAIDLSIFVLANGKKISVERHFGRPTAEPKTNEARFLRGLANRLYDEEVFSVVVTEFFDKLHRNHFHLDMARYRVDGTR